MKTRIRQGFAFVILTILIILMSAFSSFASSYGTLDEIDGSVISGWAVDTANPDQSVSVTLYVYIDGTTEAKELAKVTADQYRNDLTNAENDGHGFSCSVDWDALEGTSFLVEAYADTANGPERLYGTSRYKKEEPVPPLPVSEPAPQAPTAQGTEGETGRTSSEPVSQNPVSQASEPAADKTASEPVPVGPAAEILGLTAPVLPEAGSRGEYLGQFNATAYCSCSECSSGLGLTYSGTVPKANHTISADISCYPIGTKLMIGDTIYTVEDIGASIQDNRLDIYFDSHQEALEYGAQQIDVYAVN